jgi:hypothetical protein
MSIRKKIDSSGDLHVKKFNHARVAGRGCNKHCQCRWCAENRTHKNRRQIPVDDFGMEIRA